MLPCRLDAIPKLTFWLCGLEDHQEQLNYTDDDGDDDSECREDGGVVEECNGISWVTGGQWRCRGHRSGGSGGRGHCGWGQELSGWLYVERQHEGTIYGIEKAHSSYAVYLSSYESQLLASAAPLNFDCDQVRGLAGHIR